MSNAERSSSSLEVIARNARGQIVTRITSQYGSQVLWGQHTAS